jgi:hypothetical protein
MRIVPVVSLFLGAALLSSCLTLRFMARGEREPAPAAPRAGRAEPRRDDAATATPRTGQTEPRTGDPAPRMGRPARGTSVKSAAVIARRHARGKTPGAKILSVAVSMVDKKTLVLGACWDFINAVYTKAGFTAKKRLTVYRQPETGPFADPAILKPGDWVMYRNLPYGEIGHSALFVEWIDFDKRSALTIEYVGGKRKIPGRYREADLTKIWGVTRGKE